MQQADVVGDGGGVVVGVLDDLGDVPVLLLVLEVILLYTPGYDVHEQRSLERHGGDVGNNVPLLSLTCPAQQWAAVRTQSLSITDPPQK